MSEPWCHTCDLPITPEVELAQPMNEADFGFDGTTCLTPVALIGCARCGTFPEDAGRERRPTCYERDGRKARAPKTHCWHEGASDERYCCWCPAKPAALERP